MRTSEAVLAPLDLHHGPRLAVDQDHVAVETREAVVVEDELAVGVEDLVLNYEWVVVATVALGDGQPGLDVVVQVILGGEAHVGVLGGVVYPVIVVPERARVLDVGVMVVLVLPRIGDV